MMELADLVGVPLFGIDNRQELALLRQRGQDTLSLLPSRVYHPRKPAVDDDF
jgi:hypothetical protein